MEIRFARAARRHRIGRASVRHVMATVTPTEVTTHQGSPGWFYRGADERGRELEIIAVEVPASDKWPEALVVIHAMPTQLRRQ